MSLLLKDVIDIATNLEREGAMYYERLARLTKNKGARKIFKSFAEDERLHEETFKKLRDSENESIINISVEAETAELVNEISQDDILPNITDKEIENLHHLSAIKLGMKTEKNALKLYKHILKKIKSDEGKKIIGALISEEERHHHDLTEMHKNKTFDF